MHNHCIFLTKKYILSYNPMKSSDLYGQEIYESVNTSINLTIYNKKCTRYNSFFKLMSECNYF